MKISYDETVTKNTKNKRTSKKDQDPFLVLSEKQ